MHRLFISDLHLSEDTPAIEAALVSLLAREKELDALIILGDFFEAWVGDDDDAPFADRVRSQLFEFSRRGCEIFVARGNRDFMLGEQFASDIDGTLLQDETVMVVAGRPTLLLHGDTLCTDDVDYQQFRALVHDPAWQTEMMAKPLDARRELARQLREMSVDAASNKPEDIMDVNQTTVEQQLLAASVDRIVHGHTHRPARHAVGSSERIVLGDWTTEKGWYLRERDNDLSLDSFTIR